MEVFATCMRWCRYLGKAVEVVGKRSFLILLVVAVLPSGQAAAVEMYIYSCRSRY